MMEGLEVFKTGNELQFVTRDVWARLFSLGTNKEEALCYWMLKARMYEMMLSRLT